MYKKTNNNGTITTLAHLFFLHKKQQKTPHGAHKNIYVASRVYARGHTTYWKVTESGRSCLSEPALECCRSCLSEDPECRSCRSEPARECRSCRRDPVPESRSSASCLSAESPLLAVSAVFLVELCRLVGGSWAHALWQQMSGCF